MFILIGYSSSKTEKYSNGLKYFHGVKDIPVKRKEKINPNKVEWMNEWVIAQKIN